MHITPKQLVKLSRYLHALAEAGGCDHAELPTVRTRGLDKGINYPITAHTGPIAVRRFCRHVLYRKVCSYCDTPYLTANPKRAKDGKRFCSDRCRNSARRKGI